MEPGDHPKALLVQWVLRILTTDKSQDIGAREKGLLLWWALVMRGLGCGQRRWRRRLLGLAQGLEEARRPGGGCARSRRPRWGSVVLPPCGSARGRAA